MKKRIISLLLAMVMILGVLPVTALADSDDVVETSASEHSWWDDTKKDLKEGWEDLKEAVGDLFGGGGHGPEGPGSNPGGGNQDSYLDSHVCTDSHNAESYKVYVYVNGKDFDPKVLDILNIDENTLDKNRFFPVGEISLSGEFFNKKGETAKTEGEALINSESDWTAVKTALTTAGALDKTKLTGKYANNAKNTVDQYFTYAKAAYNVKWGEKDTALFHWHFPESQRTRVDLDDGSSEYQILCERNVCRGNAESYGYDDQNQNVHYHLDLKFTTTPVNILAGKNGIDQADDRTYYDGAKLSGNVFITNMTIGPDDVTKPTGCPAGYTTDGKLYTDYECKNEWTADKKETLKENQPLTLYVKYVKETKYNVTIDKKYVSEDTNNEITGASATGLEITLTNKDDSSKSYLFSLNPSTGKYGCTSNLPAGTYTISENQNTSIGEDWTFDSSSPNEVTIPTSASEVAEQTTPDPVRNFSFELKNLYTQVERKATSIEKSLVLDSTEENKGLPFPPAANITFPTTENNEIQPILVEGGTVKLLYKITVTGDPKANFTVTDDKTELAYSADGKVTQDTDTNVYSGTLPETAGQDGKASLEFYVVKTFENVTGSGKLENSVTLDNNTPVPTPDKVPYYTPITLPLSVKKSMSGDTLPDGYSQDFTLTITGSEKATGTCITATASITKNASTNVDFKDNDAVLTSLGTAKEEGKYEYTLSENTVANVINDARLDITLTYNVTLVNDETTGNYSLTYDLKYTTVGNEEYNLSGAQPTIFLSNTYTAPATTAAVTLTKVYSGTGSTVGTVSQIKLKNKTTNVEYTFNRQNDGKFTCESELPAGEYTVVEDANAAKIDGYTWLGVSPAEVTVTADHVKEGSTSFALTNSYKENEKTPAKVNFSDLIRKELTIKGDYSFTGETFHAKMRYKAAEGFGEDAWYEFKAEFGKNTKSGAVKDFVIDSKVSDDGDDYIVSFPKAGEYVFYLWENNDGKSGVTYDTSFYKLTVKIKEDGNKLVLDYIEYSKWNNGEMTGEADKNGYVTERKPIVFENKINTGKKGDHIKIDSPNKLNTDDHFAYIIGYPDGTVQPNGEITRAEVATIFFRLLKDDVREKYFTRTNDFSDVNRSDWFNNPVSTMAELGIVKGYPDGTFRPNEPITRAEFAAIAARFDASSRYGETRFTDVAGHWAIREIAKAYNNGWIKGYPDNTFRPNRNITRAEAMTLINRVLNRAPETEKDLLNNMNKWSDNMDVDAWYYLAVQEATNSHDYRRKTSSYEHWLRMLEDPNWAKYER